MTTPPMSKVPGYHVTGVSPGQYSTDTAGNTVEGYLVHFELADGTPGQVFVPDKQWNPGGVQSAVEHAVKTLHTVRHMHSEG
jgi:hypothetical protein